MRAAAISPIIRAGAVLGTLLLCACSTGGPAKPGTAAVSLPNATDTDSLEQRVQALEVGLQHLAQQVESLQTTAARDGHLASSRTDHTPAEYQPLRPGIVLAAHPVRRAPMPLAVPVPAPEPAPVAAPAPKPVPTRQSPGRGDWVINLASYTSRSYATRKLAEFVDEGVAAEQVQAEVNGSTVYRLRVPGFDSFRAASAEAGNIRARLGLNETWVARR